MQKSAPKAEKKQITAKASLRRNLYFCSDLKEVQTESRTSCYLHFFGRIERQKSAVPCCFRGATGGSRNPGKRLRIKIFKINYRPSDELRIHEKSGKTRETIKV